MLLILMVWAREEPLDILLDADDYFPSETKQLIGLPMLEQRCTMLKMLSIVLCVLSAGCSTTVTHQKETTGSTGVRYYENAPYLIVCSDGRGGLKWQIRYLPDQSRIMTATPSIVGGRTEMTLYFQNGVLASASTVGDTTEIPKAVISAVQSAIPLLAAALAGPAQEGFPAPYLYKLVVENNTLSFKGGKGDTSIQVPINQGPQ